MRVLLFSLFFLFSSFSFGQGKWVKLAPFPEPAEELVGASANGKVYVFCGLAPGWKPMAMVYEYDPAADKWTKKKPMALPSHHVSFTEYKGKIYAFGGFVLPQSGPPAWAPIDNAWEYDPAADNWRALAPMPTKRGSPVAASVGDRIYVIGGAVAGAGQSAVHPARPHRSVGTVEEYDPATNTWHTGRMPMAVPRNHAVGAAVNGRIYVIGGRAGGAFITGPSSNIDVVEEYDPATDAWSFKTRAPTARSAMAAAVLDSRIYISGGEFQDARMMATFRAFEAYDPAKNAWSTLPSMPTSRHGLAAGVEGRRIHMVSGDVQSALSGAHSHVDAHDAFELEGK
jgi:N-acetylneuraminic acid mutarotase